MPPTRGRTSPPVCRVRPASIAPRRPPLPPSCVARGGTPLAGRLTAPCVRKDVTVTSMPLVLL